MQFTVPKFIEREPKIVGPFTFKQFIYVAVAGAICFFLYFSVAKKNLFLFLVLATIPLGTALALAFLQINGLPLPTVIANFFRFSLAQKFYLWRKKEYYYPRVVRKMEPVKKEKKKEFLLKVDEKSRLRERQKQVEINIR